ncbi:hypothetical protein M8756_04220 [Lutimaribacter sp. EGI FJ00015]|uniref:Uncharacterized protein n=1 Tax=Lutimaribacter degradans TaxID=2945989 RepID=A0ACC5ZRF3_9RHOB|nr:hypothetical protein [Lutimaribacter sp. EGI FJ00013]MCM2560553.1 hypothetical protein [Lutimaribacter sp. EGI FJ00013]MCO0612504.1 hypothetical protein [Lutimaribacter sp. EGI FJ00015]MCO0634377.1 hypothetical protein [Lutimaribacter sp. EGI FJ00014]
MTFKTILAASALAMAAGMPASAMDAKIYPYHSKENYCPSGLQPVVLGGVVSCGQPNQSISYAEMKQHTVSRRGHGRLVCPDGEKGCYRQ